MRIVAGVLCMLLIAGCSEKDKIPSDVIARDEMEKIIWDMMLADQYSSNYLVKDSAKVNVKIETLKLYEDIFRMHKVSRDEFRKSFQFYQGRPDITRTMFDSLLARGNRARMENYAHPVAATPPAVPPVRSADSAIRARTGIKPGVKPPVVRPVKGPGGAIFPNRPAGTLPGGRPFLDRGMSKPLRAGEMPFRPVRKDSVPKGRQ